MALSKNQTIAIVAIVIVIIIAAVAAVALSDDDDDNSSKNNDNPSTPDTPTNPNAYPDGQTVTVTTFTDYNGNTADITFTEIPDRVVAGCSTALNLLLYLGLGDRIVGVYYDEEPIWSGVQDEYDKLVARIGATGTDKHLEGNVAADVLLSWQPDLVIGWVSWNENGLGTEKFWNDNGANVMSLNTMTSNKYRTLALMKTDYDNIGNIFNIKSQTDTLYNQIIEVYNQAVQSVGSTSITYALVDGAVNTDRGTVWAYEDSNFIASVLNSMGLTNAFPSGGTINLSKVYEAIGTTGIDLIIYITYGSVTYEKSEASWESDPDLAKCSAIQNHHTIGMKLSTSYGSSPALLDDLTQIAAYIKTIAA